MNSAPDNRLDSNEPEVLICENDECRATETIHFAAVGDLCYDCMLGKMRAATETECADIRASHAMDQYSN